VPKDGLSNADFIAVGQFRRPDFVAVHLDAGVAVQIDHATARSIQIEEAMVWGKIRIGVRGPEMAVGRQADDKGIVAVETEFEAALRTSHHGESDLYRQGSGSHWGYIRAYIRLRW
jgi:hypothetical protein